MAVPALPPGLLLVRARFGDDDTWSSIVSEATAESPEGFVAYDDPAYDGGGWQELRAAATARGGEHGAVLIAADADTFADAEHALLVIDLLQGRPPFRCVPSELWSVTANLELGNMDWSDFAKAVDDDGIFRGF